MKKELDTGSIYSWIVFSRHDGASCMKTMKMATMVQVAYNSKKQWIIKYFSNSLIGAENKCNITKLE